MRDKTLIGIIVTIFLMVALVLHLQIQHLQRERKKIRDEIAVEVKKRLEAEAETQRHYENIEVIQAERRKLHEEMERTPVSAIYSLQNAVIE